MHNVFLREMLNTIDVIMLTTAEFLTTQFQYHLIRKGNAVSGEHFCAAEVVISLDDPT